MNGPESGPTTAPYGSWRSPISIEAILAGSIRLSEVVLDGDDIYWLEGRPNEGGRQVVVRLATGATSPEDVTPAGFNARTMVHEYGGGAYTVWDGTVVFSNLNDGRLYRQERAGQPQPLTPEGPLRYADVTPDPAHNRGIAVREHHPAGGPVANEIVAVALDGPVESAVTVLVSGPDFVAAPRVNPGGDELAWLAWNHPNMPWDGTELWRARFDPEHGLEEGHQVAGGPDESIAQPRWSPEGVLHYVSDRTGWWNLYLDRPGWTPVPLHVAPAEFADPAWVFGGSSYAFAADGSIVAAARRNGRDELLRLYPSSPGVIEGRPRERIRLPYTEFDSVQVTGSRAVFVAGAPDRATAVVKLDLAKPDEQEVLRQASTVGVDPAYLSSPEPIEYPTAGARTARGLFYPPRNPDFAAPAGELPPLFVQCHGGPTSNASSALSWTIQLLTSRGLAFLDVDYGGSTGYGRAYRERLDGQWGVVDLDDTVSAVTYLAERGSIDPRRVVISGGSAGGYTALCAVTFREGVFTAGVSHFGVGDLEALARDTHKFESRYLDRIVGPYPDQRQTYRARSPVHFTDRISCPLLILQGLDDMVVPPAQAEEIVAALTAKGLPHAYLAFAGEGHGFRQAQNIRRSLEAELSFVAQILGFRLADDFEPVRIENLPSPAAEMAGRRTGGAGH